MEQPSAPVAVLAAGLALLLPALQLLDQPGVGAVMVALAVGLAAVACLGRTRGGRATSVGIAAPPSGYRTVPPAAALVPDPVHHPLRPRAPGTD